MKKVGKRLLAMLIAMTLCLGLCACGGGSSTEEDESGVVELEVWLSYGSLGQGYMQKIIDDFNASQDEYKAVAYNNGAASEIRTKLESVKPEDYPAVFCGTPITTCYYDSVDYVKSLQDYLNEDEEDWTAGIYESVKESYSNMDGEMLGYPNGVSCSGWFVNVDALTQAGYSVEDLTSYEKIAEAASAIKSKGICKYGLAYYGTGIEMLDMLTLQGADVVDANNGYDGVPKKSLITSGTDTYKAVEKIATIFANLYKEEVALAWGTDTAGEAFPLFNSGNLGMVYATNSWTHYVVDGTPAFEYAFVPAVGIDENAQYKGMAIPEGTGLYIANSGNEKKMQGAYEFIKFAAKPENQAYWCSCLGYVPNTDEAASQEAWTTWMAANLPSAQNVIDKIKESPKELRQPYVEYGDSILGVGKTLFSYLAVDAEAGVDTYIEDATYGLESAIKTWESRRK